jgi:transcriptional regulator with XRE-family HTH domain
MHNTMYPPAQTLQALARARIKTWLSATGMTQTALAERIHRNQAWMSRYLSEDIDADVDTLQQMAAVFSQSIGALLDSPPNPDEAKLIEAYRALKPETRPHILGLLRDLTQASRRRGRLLR